MEEIEEGFFEAFGIGPKELDYPDNFIYYPVITDTALLKLTILLNNVSGVYSQYPADIVKLKKFVLGTLTIFSKAHALSPYIIKEVKEIFEETYNEIF